MFLLGRQNNLENELKAKVLKEKDAYGDIIHVNNLIEHYDNLTLKTLYAIKWYRGTYEIFRYIPSDDPPTKRFPLAGYNVSVSIQSIH